MSLPVDQLAPRILEALEKSSRLVVEAPPGAGKTTRLPIILREASWNEGTVLVAQPRRLAARGAAVRVAQQLGSKLGELCGYQLRFDSKVSKQSRIIFLTDGLLTRRLHVDPQLKGVSAVILDEFHERSLNNDLNLALLKNLSEGLRPDLRIIVMSATLDAQPIADYLGDDTPCLRSEGRSFPVEIAYFVSKRKSNRNKSHPTEELLSKVSAGIDQILEKGWPGHILCFLPGRKEIQEAIKRFSPRLNSAGAEAFALHASLSPSEQDKVLAPGSSRKCIFSTNVAETSLTIDGVGVVLDTGLARVPRFDPDSGLSQLRLGPVSRASAIQRAGRAGRQGPGHCLRLYSEHDFERRPEFDRPEIARADLAGLYLHLSSRGFNQKSQLSWLSPPPEKAWFKAKGLLQEIHAIDGDGRITEVGKEMLAYPLEPRLARLMVEAEVRGVAWEAAKVAALLNETPIFRGEAFEGRVGDADPFFQAGLIASQTRKSVDGDRLGLSRSAVAQVERSTRQLRGIGGSQERARETRPNREKTEEEIRRCLFLAFPDRIAKVREKQGQRYLLWKNEGEALLSESSVVQDAEWIVGLRGQERRDGKWEVSDAASIDPDWLIEEYADVIEEKETLRFEKERVVGESELRFGRLVLERSALRHLPAEAGEFLFRHASERGFETFFPEGSLEKLKQRIAFAATIDSRIPVLTDEFVQSFFQELCRQQSSFAELKALASLDTVKAQLFLESDAGSAELEKIAPTAVSLGSPQKPGRRLKVEYKGDPWIASRLQDFFGMKEGPCIGRGRVPLVLHLRAPNGRDVQVTTDLKGFWSRHYPEIRRTLMRRYPRHAWPEDPVNASPPDSGRRSRKAKS